MKVIITGATGMVGEGVMHECIQNAEVSDILLLTRKPSGFAGGKVRDLIVKDFYDLSDIENNLIGYDSCLFCLGTTSVGKSNEEFYKISYTLTLSVAKTLAKLNTNMTFCYISGAGTDSTEAGRTAWARTKGKTENDLMKLPFRAVYNFRPGYLHPTPGLKNTLPYYKYLSWLFPVFNLLGANYVSTLAQLGQAMLNVSKFGYAKQIVEVRDIKTLALKTS
jgi:uncharacterized protein YbjT (DUF2867 family)